MAKCPNLFLIETRHFTGHIDYYLQDTPTLPPIPANIATSRLIYSDDFYTDIDASYSPKKKYSGLSDDIRTKLNSEYNSEAVNCISDKLDTNQSSYLNAINWLYNQVNSDVFSINTLVNNLINNGINSISNYIESNVVGNQDEILLGINDTLQFLIDLDEQNLIQLTDEFRALLDSNFATYQANLQQMLDDQLNNITIGIDENQEESLNWWEGALSDLQDLINDPSIIVDTIGDIIPDPVEGIKNILENALGDVIDRADSLIDFWGWLIDQALKPFSTSVKKLWNKFGDTVDNARDELSIGISEIEEINNKLKLGYYHDWDSLMNDLNNAGSATKTIQSVVSVLQVIPMIYQLSQMQVYPTIAHMANLSEERARASLLPDEVIATAYRKGKINLQAAIQEFALKGYSDSRTRQFIEALEVWPDVSEVRQASLRGIVSDDWANSVLGYNGYSSHSIQVLKELWKIIPPVQDLITMAVREVFTPDIANKYGLFEDFPQDFLQWARQIGLDDRWAKNYWAAHWQLPSPMQGNEMLHRGIITQDEHNDLFRALDYMPYWRDKLREISYNPLPRVDIRRIHDLGLISDAELPSRYQKFGFNEDDAKLMAAFTIAYNKDDPTTKTGQLKELSRSTIEKAYQHGIISESEAVRRLIAIGYAQNDAEFLIDLIDYNLTIDSSPDHTNELMERVVKVTEKAYLMGSMSHVDALQILENAGYGTDESETLLATVELERDIRLKSEIVSQVKELYVQRTLDYTDTLTVLQDNGFNNYEIELLFQEMDVFRELRSRKPTKPQFLEMVESGELTPDDYLEELRGLGYAERYIELYSKIDLENKQ